MTKEDRLEDIKDYTNYLDKVTLEIIDQIDTLSDIASEFSNFAKMPKAKTEKVDIDKTLRLSLELFIELPTADIVYENKSTIPLEIVADHNQISRVFNNLLKNAIQAIPEETKGKINVKVDRVDDKILITIQDNGTGISDDQKAKIFTPNFTTKTSGMGLGLAMVKNIVENSEGKIWFETAVDCGTTFYVSFPVAGVEN